MCLDFIHIGRYDIKARRHLACVQNGITQLGDWRMETWQLALTGSLSCLHPPISLVVLCHSEHMPMPSRYKGQWRGALMFYLICVWINGWVSNREAGDLRRYRAHYDVTVMYFVVWWRWLCFAVSMMGICYRNCQPVTDKNKNKNNNIKQNKTK